MMKARFLPSFALILVFLVTSVIYAAAQEVGQVFNLLPTGRILALEDQTENGVHPRFSSLSARITGNEIDSVSSHLLFIPYSGKNDKSGPQPLLAPTSLTLTPVSHIRIDLLWQDNTYIESGYQVERAPAGSSQFVLIATLPPDTTNYRNEALSAATSYSYRVRAMGTSGYTSYTDVATASTLAVPNTIPAAPSNLQATNITETTTYLSWTDNSNNEEGFTVWMFEPPGDYRKLGVVGADVTGVTITDLRSGGLFYFRIDAFNAAGSSPRTAEVKVQTLSNTTAARFVNNTSHPIIFLEVDGEQHFPISPYGILPGSYYEVTLSPGSHSFLARNGFWQSTYQRFEMYEWYGSFDVSSGSILTLTFQDPSIEQLMTNFSSSAYWEGFFWSGSPVMYHSSGFCFYSNGKFRYYKDNVQQYTGTYTLLSRGELFISFRTVGGTNIYDGSLYEQFGRFDMYNGPSDWQLIDYVRNDSAACPASP
jgi:hypothetical protein